MNCIRPLRNEGERHGSGGHGGQKDRGGPLRQSGPSDERRQQRLEEAVGICRFGSVTVGGTDRQIRRAEVPARPRSSYRRYPRR